MWQPRDLSSICPSNSSLTACSSFGYIFLNLLVELFGDSIEKRQRYDDPCDQDYEDTIVDAEDYDFIVVGAGTAGCVVANRLTEIEDWKVLLLEAGPEQPEVTLIPSLYFTMQQSNIDWAYSTEPNGKSCLARPGQRCPWPRGKVMGGSGSTNSLLYIRGNKVDYDYWAAIGNDGWSYEEVLPYFLKSEDNLNLEYGLPHDESEKFRRVDPRYHSIDGELSVSYYPHNEDITLMPVKAFIEKGYPVTDFTIYDNYGTGQAQSTARKGTRVSANQAFIQPIRYKRKNLTVRTNSEVVKILIDENKRAYGIKYVNNGTMFTATATKEVIVSGGTINSPKLLLLSGIGPTEHLKDLNIPVIEDLPVGENLHDHVTFEGLLIALSNETNTAISNEQLLDDLREYKKMEKKVGILTEIGALVSICYAKSDPNLDAPDLQYGMQTTFRWREFWPDPAKYDSVNIYPTVYYDAFAPRIQLLTPSSRGRLRLNATDPNGHPLLYPNYFEDISDLNALVKATNLFYDLENTKAFQESGAEYVKDPIKNCEQYKWGTEEYTRCLAIHYTSTPYHPVGSCRMGPEGDPRAVVDPRLRVHGISNLRVIDAAIMPNVTRGNINAPTLMIGERGADFIKMDWINSCLKK